MPMIAPVLPPPLRDGDRLTREEFLRRWEAMPDLKRAELIDGIVHMPSPVSFVHGEFHALLSGWLLHYASATPGCRIGNNRTWLMTPESVPQPDIDLLIAPQVGGQSQEETYGVGAPELVVEVSYTTTARDAGAKLRLYERSGVREYVIVKPKKREVNWLELFEGKYRPIKSGKDGVFHSRVFPGLWLDPEPLWKRDFVGVRAASEKGLATQEHAEFGRLLASRKR